MLVLLMLACGSPPEAAAEGDLAERLVVTGGCGDVVFFAVAEDQTTAVEFRAEGLLDGPRQREWTLPEDAIAVTLVTGAGLEYCDDTVEPDWRIDTETPADEGAARFYQEAGDGYFPTGTVELEGVTFGEERLDRLVIVSTIGWYAG